MKFTKILLVSLAISLLVFWGLAFLVRGILNFRLQAQMDENIKLLQQFGMNEAQASIVSSAIYVSNINTFDQTTILLTCFILVPVSLASVAFVVANALQKINKEIEELKEQVSILSGKI
jgi:hypothetical protein